MKKFLTLFVCIATYAVAVAQTPTWSANVASIVYNKCSNCHHEGSIGPFPLMSYQDAFVQAAGIDASVSVGNMPPWPPDPAFRRFAHERLLTPAEKTILLDWVAAGAPEGNPNTAPNPPVYTNAWEIPNPDLTVKMPDYFSEAVDEDMYKCFAIPSNITQDRYIKSIEVIPGNRSIVHHVLIFQDDSGDCLQLDANSPGPGYTNYGGAGSSNANLIIGWVPGAVPYTAPNGFGIKLKANSALVLQVHYPAGTTGMLDSTRINITFTDNNSVRELFIAPVLNNGAMVNGPLAIPANQVKTFRQEYTSPYKATIFSVAPHMHLIGRSTKIFAMPPQGNDTIKIIDIPDWRFGWQGFYTFQYAQPIDIGTTIYSEVVYDNTVNNPYNPNNPPVFVGNGEGTSDEMILTYFAFAAYQPGDENILLDSTLLQTNIPQQLADLSVSFYPNPAENEVYIKLPNGSNGAFNLRLFSATGQLLYNQQITQSRWINTAALPKGLYIAEVSNKTGRQVSKLVKY